MRLTIKVPIDRRASIGLSIVEMLVGIAIGLFILAGATLVVTEQLGDNRRLLLETQVQQDLRSAADLMARDVRRAGYWGSAASSVWISTGAAPINPYPSISSAPGAGGRSDELLYTWSAADESNAENDTLNAAEQFGFALNSATGVIEMKLGGAGWQDLTDSNVLRVTQFNVTPNAQTVALPCAKPCPVGVATCPPQQLVRQLVIELVGEAVHDSRVQRSVRAEIKLRNDGVTGSCPA